MAARVALSSKLTLFGGLSLLDLSLTWFLVKKGGGWFYESNPVAQFWLSTYGWVGLAGFKAFSVLLVIEVALLLARRHPRAGERLLALGCVVVAFVLTYSCTLGVAGAKSGPEWQCRCHQIKLRKGQLYHEGADLHEFAHLKGELSRELVAGRIRLVEGVRRLAQTRRGQDDRWLHILHNLYPGHTDEQCLAITLLANSVDTLQDNPLMAWQLAERLEAEYQTHFGVSPTLPPDIQELKEMGRRQASLALVEDLKIPSEGE